jgi:NAD(P)-dependent dehydrogenase (short-subunit alcohol dehydrogenase family)
MRLKDKVAFITGAAGGMGMQFSRAFLEEGARVLVTDMTAEMVDAAVAELGSPGSVIGAVVDVCERSSIEAAVTKAADTFGRLDILVNVAGGALHTPHKFNEIDEAAWDKVLDVNLKGTYLCSQVVVEQFRKQGGGGKIVNISAGSSV